MIGELPIYSSCIRSGVLCLTIVGVWIDKNSEPSSLESRLYIDMDEDNKCSSQSLALGKIFHSMVTLIFLILDVCL